MGQLASSGPTEHLSRCSTLAGAEAAEKVKGNDSDRPPPPAERPPEGSAAAARSPRAAASPPEVERSLSRLIELARRRPALADGALPWYQH